MAAKSGSAPRRGRATTSKPTGNMARCVRNASRIKRFQRLRSTELPTRRDTDNPSRVRDKVFALPCTTSTASAA